MHGISRRLDGEKGGSQPLATCSSPEPSPSLWLSTASSSRVLASGWLVLVSAKRTRSNSNFLFWYYSRLPLQLFYHLCNEVPVLRSLFEILEWVLFSCLRHSSVQWHWYCLPTRVIVRQWVHYYGLWQGCQTHFHQALYQPWGCLQRAKRNFRTV